MDDLNALTENNLQEPQQGGGWCLAAVAGLLGVCCTLTMLFLLILSVAAPSLQTSYDFRTFSLGQPADPAQGLSPTPGPGLNLLSPHVLIPAPFEYPAGQDNSLGDPHAPVKIVEYGDFQCPYCARFWSDTEKSIIRNYVMTGKVFFTYRSIVIIGPESRRAAEAAYCAGDQDRFWQYHDFLFGNQGQENSGAFDDVNLLAFGRSLGLDQSKFQQCLNTHKFGERVDLDIQQAGRDGVQATPSFLINNQLVEGAQPYADFAHIIEDLLNATPQDFPPPQGQNGMAQRAMSE